MTEFDEPDGGAATGNGDERPRLVGINHVALEVGDIDAALEFYESLFSFELRGRGESMAFLDMGDQFLALSAVDDPGSPDEKRHFGLVVDDLEAAKRRFEERGVDRPATNGTDIRDPWGNRLQLVEYGEIQFTKADPVLEGLGLEGLEKSEGALEELAKKGMEPE